MEIKALSSLTNAEQARVLNDLKAGGFPRAGWINFGKPGLDDQRLVRTELLRIAASSPEDIVLSAAPVGEC